MAESDLRSIDLTITPPGVPLPAEGSPGAMAEQRRSLSALSRLVKGITGFTLDELQQGVVEGTLPEKVGTIADPAGNITRTLVSDVIDRDGGIDPQAEAMLMEVAPLLAGVLFTPLGIPRAARGVVEGQRAAQVTTKVEGLTSAAAQDIAAGASQPLRVGRAMHGLVNEKVFDPLKDFLRTHGDQFKLPMGMDEIGSINTAAAVVVARALAGASAGFVAGTPFNEQEADQRLRDAFIGLGLGAVASPKLIKRLVNVIPRSNAIEKNTPAVIDRTVVQDLRGAGRKTSEDVDRFRVRLLATEDVDAFRATLDSPVDVGARRLGVKFSQLEDPDILDTTFRKLVNLNKKAVEGAKGGIQSEEELRQLADLVGMTTRDLSERLPGDTVSAAEIVAARQLLAASYQRLLETDAALQKLIPETNAYAVAREELARQIGITGVLSVKFSNMGTEAGRALRAFQQTDEFKPIAEVLKAIRDDALPPESIAQAIRQLPGNRRGHFVTRLFKDGPRMASNAYVNALLWTGHAPFLKLSSEIAATNIINFERLLTGAFDAVRSTATGQERAVFAKEFYDLYFGQAMSVGEGWSAAVRMLKNGNAHLVGGSMGFENLPVEKAINNRALKAAGTLATAPSRILGADTAFVKAITINGELRALVDRQVTKLVQGNAITKAERGEVFRELMDHPTPEMIDRALQRADVNTFTDPLLGVMASFQNAVQAHPSLRFLMPFYKIRTNLIRFSWDRFPVLGALSRRNAAALNSGDPIQIEEFLARQATGAAFFALGATLYSIGRLHGSGPIERNLRREENRLVPRDSVFIDGEGWVAFERFGEPMASLLGFVASSIEIAGEADQNSWEQLLTAYGIAFGENFFDKPQDVTLFRTVDALVHSDRGFIKSLKQTGKEIVASAVVPPIVQQIRRAQDPTMREARTLLNEIRNRIPGYSKDLPPRVGLDGEDRQFDPYLGPEFLGPFSPATVHAEPPDPVRLELVKNKISLSLPSATIFGVKEPLLGEARPRDGITLTEITTPDDAHYGDWLYYRYQKLAGNSLKVRGDVVKTLFPEVVDVAGVRANSTYGMWDLQQLLIQSPLYRNATPGPDGGKARLIDGLARSFRQMARFVLIFGNPDPVNFKTPEGQGRLSEGLKTGDPLLRQRYFDKQVERAGTLGGPDVARRLRTLIKEEQGVLR